MKVCRYDKDANPEGCSGCEKGCYDKPQPAYINRDFENAVKEMEQNGRCSGNKTRKS